MSALHRGSQALAVTPKTLADNYHCRLMELPAELRTQIYSEALTHKAGLEINPCGDPVEYLDEWELDERPLAKFRPSEPSLLFTCRQIREEALPVFYGCNIFQDCPYDCRLRKFITWLTPKKRLLIRSLHVSYDLRRESRREDNTVWESRGCVIAAHEHHKRMERRLMRHNISLSKDVIKVIVRLNDETAGVWTSCPEGECTLSFYCGDRQLPLQLCC